MYIKGFSKLYCWRRVLTYKTLLMWKKNMKNLLGEEEYTIKISFTLY